MFGIGMPELLLILVIALIVIGPKKLPDLAKSLGRALGEFKKATSDLKDSLDIDTDFKEVRDTFGEVRQDLRDTLKKGLEEAETPETADEDPAVDKGGGDRGAAASGDTGPADGELFDEPQSRQPGRGEQKAAADAPAGKDSSKVYPGAAPSSDHAAADREPERHG